MSVPLKTHPIEFMVTAKWDSPFTLGQSPEYTQRGALQLALPQARQEGTACFYFSWAGFPVISTWIASLSAAHSAFRADTYHLPILSLLRNGWRKGGRRERERGREGERERENQHLSSHRTAIKEHMYQLKKFLGNKSFLIEHSLFSQFM